MLGFVERKTPEMLRREAMQRIKALARETYTSPHQAATSATVRQAEDILFAVRDWAAADAAMVREAPR